MGHKHQALVKAILLRLGSRREFRLWESPVGLARSLDGKRTFRYGLTGSADITGIGPGGVRLEIEAKVGDDVQRPTQAPFQRMIETFGGIYVIAYSAEEAEEVLLARVASHARPQWLENHLSIPPE